VEKAGHIDMELNNQAASNAKTIHFNLEGVNVAAALKAPIDFNMRNNVTNSELATILTNQSLFEKTYFYLPSLRP